MLSLYVRSGISIAKIYHRTSLLSLCNKNEVHSSPALSEESQRKSVMKITIYLVVCALFMGVLMSGAALSAEEKATEQEQEIIMTGRINNSNQIIDKWGGIFGIYDTKAGREIAIHVGMKVYVKGAIQESEGQKWIRVSVFEIIKE